MTATKKKFGPKDGRTYLDNAREAWKPLPKWVEALAIAADEAASQRVLAERIGFKNPSVVSAIIRKTWPGRFDVVEAQVRGALMHAVVECPVLGEIATDACVRNQALKFSAANPSRARLSRACKVCPKALGGKKHA